MQLTRSSIEEDAGCRPVDTANRGRCSDGVSLDFALRHKADVGLDGCVVSVVVWMLLLLVQSSSRHAS